MMSGIIRKSLERLAASRLQFLFSLLAVGILVTIFASLTTGLTDNAVRVESFDPTGKTEIKTNITVKFTKDMVSKDSLDMPVLDPPVRFDPPIHGIARWIETDELRFFPDAEFLPATEYAAQIESGKTWICGYKIESKETFRFRTPLLWVEYNWGRAEFDPTEPGTSKLHGRLKFNYKVSRDELQKNMDIKGEKGAAKSSLSYTLWAAEQSRLEVETSANLSSAGQPAYSNEFEFTTENIPQTDKIQRFTVTVGKELMCQDCKLPMTQPSAFTIVVEPKVALVVNSLRAQGETGLIMIHFSAKVTVEGAKSFISIEPATEYTVEEFYGGISLRGNFKPGETYTVNIKKGIVSTGGNEMERDFSSKINIPDLPPSINFSSSAVFLPRQGSGLLEFKTVNVSNVTVEIEQVFANNLVYFLTTGYGGNYGGRQTSLLGRSLFIKEKELESNTNEPLLTTIDLAGIIGDSVQGIFKVSVRDKNRRWTADTRYAMITDIGISARLSEDYLMVWANSLSRTEPISGAAATLYSKNNQILADGKTNSRGLAIFKNIKDKLTGFEPFLITVRRDKDLSYLRLDQTLLPVADFDVSGRPYLTSGYEAFLYSDRGIYRPGDTAHLVCIVRGKNAELPPGFPYLLIIYDSQGKKYNSYRMSTEGSSMASLDFSIPNYATTGKYNVEAIIGEELTIGRYEFLIEEFMPDRIKVTLSTPSSSYRTGEIIEANVGAKFLFGPPAAGHQVSGHLTIEPYVFSPSGWSGYTFSDFDRTFAKMEIDLQDTLLDDSGNHIYRYELPADLTPPSALKGLLSATVSETGGRGVSAYSEIIIHPYERYIGLKLGLDGYAKPGQKVDAALIAIDGEGKAVSVPRCDVRFYRNVYNTVLKKDKLGVFRYMSERKATLLDSAMVEITSEGGQVAFVPTDYGSYEIVAKDTEGNHISSVSFYASGWGYSPWAMTSPEKIELEMDKKNYVPGDKGVMQVRAPFGGKLMITIEKSEVIDVITQDMPAQHG